MKKISLVGLLSFVLLASAHAGTTGIQIVGSKGDWISEGRIHNLSVSADETIALDESSNLQYVSIRYDNNRDDRYSRNKPSWFDLTFHPKNTETLKAGGEYQPDNFWIVLSGDGRSCSSTQKFKVLEIQLDKKGRIVRFAADFTQQCDNSKGALNGQVRINSTLPLSLLNGKIDESSKVGTTGALIKYSSGSTLASFDSSAKSVITHRYAFGISIVIGDSEPEFSPAPGSYLAAGNCYNNAERMGEGNQIEFSYGGLSYGQQYGKFCILELTYDQDGNIKRLAVDFNEDVGDYFGQYRINSTIGIKL